MADDTDVMPQALTVMTDQGVALIKQLAANSNKITAFRAVASDTVLYSVDKATVAAMTDLQPVKQTGIVQAVVAEDVDKSKIQIDFQQSDIEADYSLNSVGLFATDANGVEVLYAIESQKTPQPIGRDTNASVNTQLLHVAVGRTENVSLTVSPDGMVSNLAMEGWLKPYLKISDFNAQLPKNIATTDAANTFAKSQTLAGGATDGAGNAIATTKDVSDGDATTLTSAKEYADTQASDKVKTADTASWQKHKLTGDDGSAKLVIASGEDMDAKLKTIIGNKDTGKLLVDIDAKNNPTGHSLIGEYFCDFDGLVTGYGIGPDGAMWNFTYNGTTTIWKWILTAKAPGIPKLAVTYSAISKAFDYTLTAPEKDGLSDIIQYNLLWKDHSVDDWTTVIVKPDALTGQLTGVDITKTYDFKAAAQNAVGASGFTHVITLGTAAVPGIPSLTVEYNAGKKGFDYTVTAPESDGGSEITGYSLEYQKQGGADWTKVALNPDSLTGTVTDGIEAGSNYLFRVNAENAVGSSDYFTVSDPLPTVDGNIYGVSWDGSSSGVLQRTDAAVGLKAGINGAQNDFDTRGPWGLMDKTVTDSYGNAFVRVPKFYIRKTQNKPLSTWQVSLVKQGDDWYLPNCFYDFDTNKELDYVDVSRYEGSIASGKLQSKTGATPTAYQTIVQLRSSAVANNTNG
uniref:fibronectin type III domain-containing protein n=1 Tax=Levilactobacillus sp. 244-2 TaxID=2799569 RepID=UPI00194E5F26